MGILRACMPRKGCTRARAWEISKSSVTFWDAISVKGDANGHINEAREGVNILYDVDQVKSQLQSMLRERYDTYRICEFAIRIMMERITKFMAKISYREAQERERITKFMAKISYREAQERV
ncbi:hypothetical protein CFP56_031179 [Quercus suber]|uniref:Uncharacterized protein n=1 Tax=Quercus suber TaxID=58331 RepID=A0AAW0JK62_QUESU